MDAEPLEHLPLASAAGPEEELSSHRGGHPGTDPRAGAAEEPQPQEHQALHPRRVRQDARGARYVTRASSWKRLQNSRRHGNNRKFPNPCLNFLARTCVVTTDY